MCRRLDDCMGNIGGEMIEFSLMDWGSVGDFMWFSGGVYYHLYDMGFGSNSWVIR